VVRRNRPSYISLDIALSIAVCCIARPTPHQTILKLPHLRKLVAPSIYSQGRRSWLFTTNNRLSSTSSGLIINMGAASWAVPVGILAAIVVVAFAFIWWWFPRAWQSGVNADFRDVEEAGTSGLDHDERVAARLANRERARGIVQRALEAEQARNRGEVVEISALEYDEYGKPKKPAGFAAH